MAIHALTYNAVLAFKSTKEKSKARVFIHLKDWLWIQNWNKKLGINSQEPQWHSGRIETRSTSYFDEHLGAGLSKSLSKYAFSGFLLKNLKKGSKIRKSELTSGYHLQGLHTIVNSCFEVNTSTLYNHFCDLSTIGLRLQRLVIPLEDESRKRTPICQSLI